MNFRGNSFNYIEPMRQPSNFLNSMMKIDRNDFRFSNMNNFNRMTPIRQDTNRLGNEMIPIDTRHFNQNFDYLSDNTDEEEKGGLKINEDLFMRPYSSIMRPKEPMQMMVNSVLLDSNDSGNRQNRNPGFSSMRDDSNLMSRFGDHNQYERGNKQYMNSSKFT